ncbi:hypothetical protein [Cellulomonas sp. C5510]|uniref:hypothetical protein n=1 Tax=Cellulomonas sp. C5510 TaxID=2871170 RepID=UPI001C940863|nr:hypothetical protein [Cellulomonas sp. C5510]QZN84753.1 hypothetical protein K5O09_13075 [Cellulomonas sp. C5510]
MTADAAAAFDALAAALAPLGVRRGRMMGHPVLSVEKRMIACLDDGVLGVRLGSGSPAHTATLGRPGAAVFSPGGRGRAFRDWVGLPLAAVDHWEEATLEALRAVRDR